MSDSMGPFEGTGKDESLRLGTGTGKKQGRTLKEQGTFAMAFWLTKNVQILPCWCPCTERFTMEHVLFAVKRFSLYLLLREEKWLMTPRTKHPLSWLPLRESTGSFPHFPLSTSKFKHSDYPPTLFTWNQPDARARVLPFERKNDPNQDPRTSGSMFIGGREKENSPWNGAEGDVQNHQK